MNESQPVTASNVPAAPSSETGLGKAITALMEAVALEQPTYQGKLNVQMVWHYLQAPDICWGWDAAKNGGALPMNTKLLCVAACLKLGFTPGMGHVIWMGNKPYVTAEGQRLKANGDPSWVYTKPPRLRPLTGEEKEMYQIEPGDLAGMCEAQVVYKGQTLDIDGLGIVEKNDSRPGGQGKKNRAMKLKTFAERDMLRRHYPCSVSVNGEQDEDGLEPIQVQPIQAIISAKEDGARRDSLIKARALLDATMRRIVDAGKNWTQAGQAVGRSIEVAGASENPDELLAMVDALLEYALKVENEAKEPAPAPAKVETPPEAQAEEKAAFKPRAAKAAKKVEAALVTPAAISTEEVMKMTREPTQEVAAPVAEPVNRGGWASNDSHKEEYRGATPKPYEMIERLRPTSEVKADIGLEMELMGLYDSKLLPGDEIQIAKAVRVWLTTKGKDRAAMLELSESRQPL